MTENDTDTMQRGEVDTPHDESHQRSDAAAHGAAGRVLDERHIPTIEWLESEFPEWEFEVDSAEAGGGEVTRWVARKEGHHQQAELSAGKLQRRLSEYLDRRDARGLNPEDN
ncbi:MAG: hypothetical protein KY437_00300 [Actinobacteria bacterium]|nr:hypothetical protein [Actinomycetota bacterium]